MGTKKEEMDLALRSWICLWLPIFQARVERMQGLTIHKLSSYPLIKENGVSETFKYSSLVLALQDEA